LSDYHYFHHPGKDLHPHLLYWKGKEGKTDSHNISGQPLFLEKLPDHQNQEVFFQENQSMRRP
jgi:hypothetical protein